MKVDWKEMEKALDRFHEMNSSEQRYWNLLSGKTYKCTKLDIENLIILMNNELNINTLMIQKSGRDTYYIKVDELTKQYYLERYSKDYEKI